MQRKRRIRPLLWLLLALLLAGLGAAGLRVGPAPRVAIRPALPAIGPATTLAVEVVEPARGISHVEVDLVQGTHRQRLIERSGATLPGWRPFGFRDREITLGTEAGRATTPALVEGSAIVRVTAVGAPSWWRRGRRTVEELELPVRFTPPTIEVLSTATYVTQGGSEAVVYRVGPSTVRDGVRAGDRFFRGWPLPGGGAQDRFALFAAPYDLADGGAIELVAVDDVGNERRARFVDRYSPLPPHTDEVQLSDAFLDRVLPAILAAAPALRATGDRVEDFLLVNRELRRQYARALEQLAGESVPAFLWNAPFLALPGGQVMSSFADRRVYYYGGREIDRQDHLGFDLASIRHADVPAANAGLVVLARDLGIYGNTVVLDHGYGLMTLYAHLSSIDVAPGERVKRGQRLGRSGETGLAGGDHLHFSFLLQGLPVRPVEWWDPAWIANRLKRKLGNALPYSTATGG